MGKEGLVPGSIVKRVTGTRECRLVELKSILQELSYKSKQVVLPKEDTEIEILAILWTVRSTVKLVENLEANYL